MSQTLSSARLSLAIDVHWQSQNIDHHEHFFIEKLNTWRDLDPSNVLFPVARAVQGETISVQSPAGDITGSYDPKKRITIRNNQLGLDRQELMVGRFYPQGIISGIPGVFKENINPFRLVDIDELQAVA
ncbi:MAG: hypothetical protein CSB23_00425, partial [Deltaproteobacteria bacterium]